MWQNLEEIIKTYHSSIATLIAGAVALYLYWRAKKDETKTAAKMIILEIKEAEKICLFRMCSTH